MSYLVPTEEKIAVTFSRVGSFITQVRFGVMVWNVGQCVFKPSSKLGEPVEVLKLPKEVRYLE